MFNTLLDSINRIFRRDVSPFPPLPAGMYTYQSPADADKQYRLHLRLEENGTGLLIINARTTLHLNQTAAEFAYYMVKGASDSTVIDQMSRRYNTKSDTIRADYTDLLSTIDTLARTEDLDPESYFGVDRTDPYSGEISSPYRLDCALTYQQNTESAFKGVPSERVKRELLTAEWQTILSKAWNAGIPHIIFTGGEPTMRPDLPELISHAEKLGQVTGLLTDGYRLSSKDYMHSLLNAGLDHIMILLDSRESQSWEAIRDALVEDIFVTVHLTVTTDFFEDTTSTMDRLQKMGVKSISISGSKPGLDAVVKKCGEYIASKGINLVWDLPVPYSNFHPVALELGEFQPPSGAGRAWMYLEPDGDVLPAQGVIRPLGNLLTDDWASIWNNPQRQL